MDTFRYSLDRRYPRWANSILLILRKFGSNCRFVSLWNILPIIFYGHHLNLHPMIIVLKTDSSRFRLALSATEEAFGTRGSIEI